MAGSPGATSPGTALCRDTASVTGLKIVRDQVARVPELQITFPNQVTVASPARARAVARALCALPLMPRGIFNCPSLVPGTTYLLRFTAGGRLLAAVTIEATGCEVVTGIGPTRRAATSPGFWRVLGTAAHLRPPGRSAFSGVTDPGLSCDPSREQANGCPAVIQPGAVAVP
jgi:Tfp pilus tip-associated adhesin PilY1